MTTFVEGLQLRNTTTENGMTTNSSSLNECVNLFFTIGAMRNIEPSRIISSFTKAFNEDPQTALRILFWSRDVRGGAGERNTPKVIFKYLGVNKPESIKPFLSLIPEYGRWDDLFVFFGTKLENDVVNTIMDGLKGENGLLAKWLPRKGVIFNTIRKKMDVDPKTLRKLLVRLSNTVEQKMCSKQWETIEYGKIPSLALGRYTNAFVKNDKTRFEEYKKLLSQGVEKINTGAIYPYDVIKTLTKGDTELANLQWSALPNFMESATDEMILPVVDVSGSMSAVVGDNENLTCLLVAISLGLYISERNEGPFKDYFITFSEMPQLQKVNGSLIDRYNQMRYSNWGYNTDLVKTFELILNQSIINNVSQDQMPKKILILSDMEFDEADKRNDTAFDMIKRKYSESGYELPKIIFWNLRSRQDNFPVRFDQNGTALISGFSPSILKPLLGGEEISPLSIMNKTINSERYLSITV
jgi:hypothetical protein